MADRQIDELSFASDISDATTFAANNNSSTYEAQQVSVGQIATFMGARADAVHNLGDLHYNKSNLAIDNPGAVPGWTGEYVTNANNVYPELYTWLKTSHPELCVTRAQYDTDIIATDECKYFVIDEVSGSIRFPKYKYVAPDYPWIYVFNAAVPQSTAQGAAYTEALVSKASIDLSNLNEAGELKIGQNARNIGELVPSVIPLTSAGLHLLDGSLLQGSGAYANFVTYIKRLYTENPTASYFTTEENWQSSYATYGSCGKFVYNSTNNTVRLPRISDIIQGTTDVSALGDLVAAGLPSHTHSRGDMNITGTFGKFEAGYANYSGAFYNAGNIGGRHTSTGSTGIQYGFDASRSWTGNTSAPQYSSAIGTSNTVQPQTIKVLYYIVVSNAAKTEIQVDIDQITTDVNGKADKDLSNINPASGVLKNWLNTENIRVVIETYSNGTSWYRVYSDGWCEQGGLCSISQDTATTVTLLKEMANTNYSIMITARRDGTTQTGGDGNFTADPISTTQFYWRNGDDFGGYGYWEVRGFAR